MSTTGPLLKFDVAFDDFFVNFVSDKSITPVGNKKLFSLLNDFEGGKWRYSKFQNFIWDNIAETALSYKERESLIDQNHSLLVAAAKNLRLTDSAKDELGKGSELAEVVLYGIMKNYYGSLSVVPKIFYKQNVQDNAKGADSVHIVIENDNDFSLWLGEAKFYNSIEDDRLGTVIESVFNSLNTDKLKKENSIITSVSDLDMVVLDKVLNQKIKLVLSQMASIDSVKPRLHIPILLLHECPITKAATSLDKNYRDKIINHHKERAESYFKKQIKKMSTLVHLYSEIQFHIILFPVPEKKLIVEKFVSNVDHYKGQ